MCRITALFLLSAILGCSLWGCASPSPLTEPAVTLVEVARSDRQWTGIAVARDGRIFVNYPRWSDVVPVSVGELAADGTVSPYPNTALNQWDPAMNPAEQFVCVQSVVVDREGFLWILDPANPHFQGVIAGGPKLLKVDLDADRIIQTIHFAAPAVKPNSYLNDVRIDIRRQVAYITDSGAAGLVVVDLASGASRRVLEDHPSTRAEGITLTIGGRPWLRPDGSAPQVHADGIALDPAGEFLYYQALSGRNLYRSETRALRNAGLSPDQVASKVEHLHQSGASDGLLYGADQRIYISALEENAVKAYTPGGDVAIVVQGELLAWPDSFAAGPDGSIYVTTSQLHLGRKVTEPYKIFKLEFNR